MRGVQRIDTENTHGWQGRAWDREAQKMRTRFYSDGAHGGTESAYEKACRWREENATAPAETHVHTRPNRGEQKSNLLGVPGVHLYEHSRGFWQVVATWCPEPYKKQTRQFSVNKYGFEEAVRKACELRFQHVGDRHPEASAEELFKCALSEADPAVVEELLQ